MVLIRLIGSSGGNRSRSGVLLVRVLLLPEGVTAMDDRNLGEVIVRRRGRHRPFERAGVPRVVAGHFTLAGTAEGVVCEQPDSGNHEQHAKRCHQVPHVPAHAFGEREVPPRHSNEAQVVHRTKRHVHTDEDKPEAPLAQVVAHHTTGHLREPVEDSAQDGHDRAAKEHVMNVGNDVVGVRLLQVGRGGGVCHTAQSTDGKQRDKPDRKVHRRFELYVASP